MTLTTPWRFVLVFAAVLVVGGGGLYLLLAGDDVEPRRGIRIPTVTDQDPLPDSPVPGLPAVKSSEGAEYSRYERVEFETEDGETVAFEYLSAHLSLERAFPMELRAEGVLCRIYPAPVTVEEARALGETPAVPVVTIRAGRARLKGVFREATEAGEARSEWELSLVEDVVVDSKEEGAAARLAAEELTCYPEERRIVAARRFSLTSEGYSIEGEGLSGHAGLGTFVVERKPVLTLPTAAVLGEISDGESTTVITCDGPLLVQRLDSEEPSDWVRSRVEFKNRVSVTQTGPSGTDRIDGDALDIELDVRQQGGEEGGDRARVRELTADGSVVLRAAAGTHVGTERLRVVPGEKEDRIELTGPTTFRHEGALEEGGPEGQLRFRSEGDGVITRSRETEAFTARLGGGVVARRLDQAGTELLSIRAKEIHLRSDPAEFRREMTAVGQARFESSGVEGEAAKITWAQIGEAKTEIRLIEDAIVTAQAGANLDPFAVTETPAEDTTEKTVIVLTAKKALELDESGEAREFRLIDGAMIRRMTDDREVMRVTADRIDASVESEVVKEVRATGSVVATGRPTMASQEGDRAVDVAASGDEFVYRAAKGDAVLSGGPAEARIRESGDGWNLVRAKRLVFETPEEGNESSPGALLAEGDVVATVFLAGKKDGKATPFTLSAGRLRIVPAPDRMAGEHQEETGASGRIDSILAEENVVLDGVAWKAKGDRLTYSGRGGKKIVLTGNPARMERRQKLAGQDYDDWFTADTINVTLRDKELVSFQSPTGGSLLLHREAGKGEEGPRVMGTGGGDDGEEARVERFTGSCSGELIYDRESKEARMVGDAEIEQAIRRKGEFRRVGRFRAKLVRAWLEEGPDGDDRLARAEGSGDVEGDGEDWTLTCSSFTVDFAKKRTTITGKPAVIVLEGAKNSVEHAEYDYGADQWEFYRATTK